MTKSPRDGRVRHELSAAEPPSPHETDPSEASIPIVMASRNLQRLAVAIEELAERPNP